jgi:ABC-type transport system involved in multi-copper enzyme maturation permease subunit
MPVFVNWLLRLLPTNPICMRLVQGGSRRMRHLYIRAGYLGLTIVVLLFVLIAEVGSGGGGSVSLRNLASSGAKMFQLVSYLQVGLICVLTPVFMAGAIAQEANPQTWDILLTTPLNNLQVVLGNLFGRLFFVIALLFSSLPLFAVTQYFGGVPGNAIFASYAIAGASALIVAAVAVTLSVTRTAGRRAVFVFYISVIMYLFVTYAIDLNWRTPSAIGAGAYNTTVMTPLNPFLALSVLLYSNQYVPHDPVDYVDSMWLVKMWFTRPIAAFVWLCAWISLILVAFSTIRLRVIGAKIGSVPWYRKIFGLTAKGAAERPARNVSHNPISWREASARGKTLPAMLARWGFVAIGVGIAIVLVTMFHTGVWSTTQLQLAVATVLAAEIVVITLAALNMSATAVSREREDGTLDIILTTPIQPGPYLAGKLKGLIQFLLPMISVPVITLLILAIYVMTSGLGAKPEVWMTNVPLARTTDTVNLPVVLPEGAISLPIMLIPFVAFCVMVGLHWSIRSKGTIGSVIAAVFIVLAVAGVLSLCGMATGSSMDVVGGVLNTFSPINHLFAIVYPASTIPNALNGQVGAGRASIVVGSFIAAVGFTLLVYGLHSNMKRTFMMTVRRLAGQA